MKKLVILCLLLSCIRLYADMVITESVDMGGQTMSVTMKFKGTKIRMDATPEMSTITDTSTGDTLTIMHTQKAFMLMPGSQINAMREQLMKLKNPAAATGSPAEKPKLVDTGKTEKVGNYNTRIYTMDTSSSKITFWVTKDIPNYEEALNQLKKFHPIGNPGASGSLATDMSDLNGFPVKTQFVSNGSTVTATVLSVEDKPVGDAEMAPPATYKKMTMPGFGGAGAPITKP